MSEHYLLKARKLTAQDYNKDIDGPTVHEDNFYVVWFAKTLQNWKALVSTDIEDGLYYEVTYNGDKKEAYVDRYVKTSNVAIKDDPNAD